MISYWEIERVRDALYPFNNRQVPRGVIEKRLHFLAEDVRISGLANLTEQEAIQCTPWDGLCLEDESTHERSYGEDWDWSLLGKVSEVSREYGVCVCTEPHRTGRYDKEHRKWCSRCARRIR